eukprot:SAG11_NODE_5813_length_1458_cov_1.481236_2_plen_75_part_00
MYWMREQLSSLALQYEQADESGSEAGHGSDHESESGGREPEAEQAGQTTPVRKDGGAASETPGLPLQLKEPIPA